VCDESPGFTQDTGSRDSDVITLTQGEYYVPVLLKYDLRCH
jgi:hypothetical protein